MRLIEAVSSPETNAGVDDGARLGLEVPAIEVLVDELLEDSFFEADAGRDDGRRLEELGDTNEDRRGGHDRVGTVGPQP